MNSSEKSINNGSITFLKMCFQLCWVFTAAWALSQIVASRCYLLAMHQLLIAVTSLIEEHRLQAQRLQSCRSPSLELQLSSHGTQALVAAEHVGYSRTRDLIHVPWIGRWIPVQCPTREVLGLQHLNKKSWRWVLLAFGKTLSSKCTVKGAGKQHTVVVTSGSHSVN